MHTVALVITPSMTVTTTSSVVGSLLPPPHPTNTAPALAKVTARRNPSHLVRICIFVLLENLVDDHTGTAHFVPMAI
jgi:hypothetical protein